jgi:hypothetical protein
MCVLLLFVGGAAPGDVTDFSGAIGVLPALCCGQVSTTRKTAESSLTPSIDHKSDSAAGDP